MFFTGTKFTFYSIFIIAGATSFCLCSIFRRKACAMCCRCWRFWWWVVGFRSYAPMQQRESQSAYARSVYQQR